jgi:hypothetical protein
MDSLHFNIQNYKFGFFIETRVDLLVKIKVLLKGSKWSEVSGIGWTWKHGFRRNLNQLIWTRNYFSIIFTIFQILEIHNQYFLKKNIAGQI